MTTKPYSTDEIPQSQPVSEPAVSYGLPQDTASLKLAAINELMNIFDPERLSQAVDYLRSLGREEVKESVPPCQFTSQELKAGIRIAMEQSRQGLGLTNEEMRNRKRPWRRGIKWMPFAIDCIDRICLFLAEKSPSAADRLDTAFYEAVTPLLTFSRGRSAGTCFRKKKRKSIVI